MIYKALIDENGEPKIFHHDCDESRQGEPMSLQELEIFIAKSIASEYAKRNVEYVWNDNRKDSNSPHFMLKMRCSVVNVIVNIDRPTVSDVTEMLFKFDEYGQIPRLYVAEQYCMETEGGEAICGGNYAIRYTPLSLLIREEESCPAEILSDKDLSELLARAWNDLDISLIEPYLAKNLQYSSEWVFDILPSRYEYLKYIKGKFISIRNGDSPVTASTLVYSKVGLNGILLSQNNVEAFLSIKTRNGLIYEMQMRDLQCLFEGIEPTPITIETEDVHADPETDENELFEGHGDHWGAIMPTETFVDMIGDLIQKGKILDKVHTEVSLENFDGNTDVVPLCHYDNQFMAAFILGYNPKENINQLITSYPILSDDDYSYEMKITKVVPWGNKVEAIVWGVINQFEVAFFATDYVNHKSSYVAGNTLSIILSGLAMELKKGLDDFEFTGQQAIDFLAKTGQKPTYLPNGDVEPVRFNTKNMVAFMQLSKKSPEDAEFQSPILNIKHFTFLDVPMTQAEIIIHRNSADGSQIKMHLFFRDEMLPKVNVDDSISGYLWLMGEVNDR